MRGNDHMKADSHLHSTFSTDGVSEMEELIRAGITQGFSCMIFTEHKDIGMPKEEGEEHFDFSVLDTDAYFRRGRQLQEKYAGQIKIGLGVEAGMLAERMPEISAFAASFAFDEIIASQHLFRGHDCYWTKYYVGLSPQNAAHAWIAEMRDNLSAMREFDILAHPDYMLRYAGEEKDRAYSLYSDDYAPILRMLAETGRALEVNIGSLRRGGRITGFYQDILRHYRDLGGELVSIGTDAHSAEGYGTGFDPAEELLRICGFRFYAHFVNRAPETVKL